MKDLPVRIAACAFACVVVLLQPALCEPIEVVNHSGEINGGIDRQSVNDPAVPGWSGEPNAQVINDGTVAGNGRWRLSIEDSGALYQLTSHRITPGAAYSLRFDSSSFSGLPPYVIAELYVTNGNMRQAIASRAFHYDPAELSNWQHFQLLTGYGDLDAHAGKQLGIQFRGEESSGSRFQSIDDVRLEMFTSAQEEDSFASDWDNMRDAWWVGPDCWANRLQDWRVAAGRLECIRAATGSPRRTVHLLTHRVGEAPEDFTMSVRTGSITGTGVHQHALTGFLVGAGQSLDYRGAALVHHTPAKDGGILAGADGLGRATIRTNAQDDTPILAQGSLPVFNPAEMIVELTASYASREYSLRVAVLNASDNSVLSEVTLGNIEPARLIGSLALVSHPGPAAPVARYWFSDWRASGRKLTRHPDRVSGPILSAQHTLSDGVLKMTAQLMPVSTQAVPTVSLQVDRGGAWETIATEPVNDSGYVAVFRVPEWDSTVAWPYRLAATTRHADNSETVQYFGGTVRPDPVDKPVIVLAGFTGNQNIANAWYGISSLANPVPYTEDHIVFPHNEVAEHVWAQDPDILFFSGDQVYEGGGPTGADTAADRIERDYLYKWYLWCWAYRELTRNIPCICIPDDHDVYQGNLWGQGGRVAPDGRQENGGYVRPPSFVQMVERTQTSFLPDPFDPTPANTDTGIGVYYTSVTYGGIGLAVLEDRKFKHGRNDTSIPESEMDLLGERQHVFLDAWGQDWRGEQMKATLSQTVFGLTTTHASEGYNYRTTDKDSNAWPPAARDVAVDKIRRSFSLMVGGDQHLATVVHHGINAFADAGFSFCVPSVHNAFPRCWDPGHPASGTTSTISPYKGNYIDSYGHPLIFLAASNPAAYYQRTVGVPPSQVHDRAPGYGIVRFDKQARTYTLECWPRYVDPHDPSTGDQYPDWPIVVDQLDNYAREPYGCLPLVHEADLTNPVIQVINESNGDILYTLRIKGNSWRPPVFADGSYTVRVSVPETGVLRTYTGQRPGSCSGPSQARVWPNN